MMGSYSNRNHFMPEATIGVSVPQFAWFYPGRFYSSPKSSSIHSESTQINEQEGIAVAPIRSVAPTVEPVSIPAKTKKQKTCAKDSNKMPSKSLKPKQPKKASSKKKEQSVPETKHEKRNLNVDIDRTKLDFSGVPSPFCSCTGMPRVCYKWGAGGWQSSCCTFSTSEYPLPMSSTRPGARVAGRKMSNGAYLKLVLKLAAEGHDLSHPIDLKDHWARHGTNKFVTIK